MITDPTPVLAGLLGPPPADRREQWIVDGTLIPAGSTKATAKSKNYRASVNIQVLARRRDPRIVGIGRAWPGNRNDCVVIKDCGLADIITEHGKTIGDGGYRGVPLITSPAPGPGGRIIKDATWKRFKRRRATAEHVIARLKDWQVPRHARRGNHVDDTTQAVAALHNLRLDIA